MSAETPSHHLDLAGVFHGTKAFIGPEHVVIDLTNRCDHNCIACWTKSPLLRDAAPPDHWHNQQLSSKLAKQLIDDLADLGTKRIRFTGGGEPFQHHAIMDLAAHVKARGMILAITTSFTSVDPQKIDRLIEIGVDTFSVSVWAGTAQSYSRTHLNRTERTFERLREYLLYLKSKKRSGAPELILCNVLCSANYYETESMLDFAIEVGADGIYYTLVDAVPGSTDGLLLTPEQRAQVLEGIGKIEEKAEFHRKRSGQPFLLDNFDGFVARLRSVHASTGMYDKHDIEQQPCYIGWHFCRILADGKVGPCCRGADHPLGDLNERSFKEIWFSKLYDEFRDKAKRLSKDDPYFAKLKCHTMCDNLMHNREMQRRIDALPPDVRAQLERYATEAR